MSIAPTIRQLINEASSKLNWSPTPRLDAELLLAHILEKDRTYIASNPRITVSDNDVSKSHRFISRRQKKEPIAYIISTKEFYGFEFKVTKDTLIPRPETEILVDKAIEIVAEENIGNVADVGTGSGCIILSIAKEVYERNLSLAKSIKWIATDISENALTVAKENSENLFTKREMSVNFLHGDLLSPIRERVDLIISNPPYIPQPTYEALEVNVREFEPKGALLGGETGIEIINQLFSEAKERLNTGGIIMIEMHYDQANDVTDLANKTFPNSELEIVKDYAGLDRIAIIRT